MCGQGWTVILQARWHGMMESKEDLEPEDRLLVAALPPARYVTLRKLASVGLRSLIFRMGIVTILPV